MPLQNRATVNGAYSSAVYLGGGLAALSVRHSYLVITPRPRRTIGAHRRSLALSLTRILTLTLTLTLTLAQTLTLTPTLTLTLTRSNPN